MFLFKSALTLIKPNILISSTPKVNKSKLETSIKDIINHLIYYPTAANVTYFWGSGSIVGLFLLFQIITGIFLSTHYYAGSLTAFQSIVHLIYDVPYGWLWRSLHANGASFFFIFLYIHIGRGIYYGSYIAPRNWVYISGIACFIISIAIGFIGYLLPWGQISYWGATVITNIIRIIPFVGADIQQWFLGYFAVADTSLFRFYSLHYLLPFILCILVIIHLSLLHKDGSNNPSSITSKENDTGLVIFYPYFFFKDLQGLLVILIFYIFIVCFESNLFGHPDNYIEANSLVTPSHIVPEWYFLPFYAVLRAVPTRDLGVIIIIITLFWNILICVQFFLVKIAPQSIPVRTIKFYYISQLYFWLFICNFLLLGILGGYPVAYPYYQISQYATFFYFFYFIFSPLIYILETNLLKYKFKKEINIEIISIYNLLFDLKIKLNIINFWKTKEKFKNLW